MGLVIFLLIVAAVGYLYFSADPSEYKVLCKGRTVDQKKALRYFMVHGCLKKTVKDEEYDALVESYVTQLNAKQKAMDKIGLDESQLREIEPVHFEGYYFDKKTFAKKGEDGKYRSSAFQISWVFFSSTEVYLYRNTFRLNEDGKEEVTEEYFYKDVTNFSTKSETKETLCWDPKKGELLTNVDSNSFSLSVSGGNSLYCSMAQNDYTEKAIQGMKAKLREKKS